MAGNRMICTTNQVDYATIRKAMCEGARTQDDLIKLAGICNSCAGCKNEVDSILASVCGCMHVSLDEVLEAVKNGADTVEKVGEITGAGTGLECGRCQALIANIIELGR